MLKNSVGPKAMPREMHEAALLADWNRSWGDEPR